MRFLSKIFVWDFRLSFHLRFSSEIFVWDFCLKLGWEDKFFIGETKSSMYVLCTYELGLNLSCTDNCFQMKNRVPQCVFAKSQKNNIFLQEFTTFLSRFVAKRKKTNRTKKFSPDLCCKWAKMGPKIFFLTSHHVNGMIGSKNPSKVQNWDRYFVSHPKQNPNLT